MSWIVYNETPTPTNYKGFRQITPYYDLDASHYYLEHYSNWLMLDFIAKNSDQFVEKQQANKEIAIAQKKMDYWKKHPNWNQKEVEKGINHLKKQWAKQ